MVWNEKEKGKIDWGRDRGRGGIGKRDVKGKEGERKGGRERKGDGKGERGRERLREWGSGMG